MIKADEDRLRHIVQRYAACNEEIEKLKDKMKGFTEEQKELAAAAEERLQIPKKVIKQLAKESALTLDQRNELRAAEEKLDECRHALGMLSDTPLGQAAVDKAIGVDADGKPVEQVKRGRGRPPGSKNKPKLTVVPPTADDEAHDEDPPIPNIPDAGEHAPPPAAA